MKMGCEQDERYLKKGGQTVKIQWSLIWGLLFALIVALFAVFNVDGVSINYLFGKTEIPLIIVIIGSALLGGLVVGLFGIVRQYKLQWEIKRLKKELAKVTAPAPAPESGAEAVSTENQTENGDNSHVQPSHLEDSSNDSSGSEGSDRENGKNNDIRPV